MHCEGRPYNCWMLNRRYCAYSDRWAVKSCCVKLEFVCIVQMPPVRFVVSSSSSWRPAATRMCADQNSFAPNWTAHDHTVSCVISSVWTFFILALVVSHHRPAGPLSSSETPFAQSLQFVRSVPLRFVSLVLPNGSCTFFRNVDALLPHHAVS